MRIESLHIRHFRSVESGSLTECGGLNVLIGKNNAGKSNVLAAIDTALAHLRRGRVAATWDASRRPSDAFTGRDLTRRFQIGVDFALEQDTNHALRELLIEETTQFERAIDQIRHHKSLAFIIAGALEGTHAYLFLEAVAVGRVKANSSELAADGIRLLEVPPAAGRELYINEREASDYRSDLAALDRIETDSPGLEYTIREKAPYSIARILGEPLRSPMQRKLETALKTAADTEQFLRSVEGVRAEMRAHISEIEQRETETPIRAFAGDTRNPPGYATWLMRQYGAIPVIHFREIKQPIGQEEAAALLSLKVRRGGEARFSAVKHTVKELLGVNVDAFEADDAVPDRRPAAMRARRPAEMDVNDFVVEANGAGIREALRIVLDLELKAPRLVLIEEPEVHLHPGLEQALHTYLLERSVAVQMFLTTHSTNFVDAASLQNVYLVSRDAQRHTVVDTVVPSEGAFRIPSELGLRLSTVFMFDRLVFVEGRSDEDVLRELARQLGHDLTRANVGFVQMGGVRNFAHFAAEGTLDLLSRRRIRMWFITDRDENTDDEVARMLMRLGERAQLKVLERRELENYLLTPRVVADLITEKRLANGLTDGHPAQEQIATAIVARGQELKDEVIRLRLDREVLRPIFLQSRTAEGTPQQRLEAAQADLAARLAKLETRRTEIEAEVNDDWEATWRHLVPGALLLERVARQFGVKYVKEVDSVRLARKLDRSEIAAELATILKEVTC